MKFQMILDQEKERRYLPVCISGRRLWMKSKNWCSKVDRGGPAILCIVWACLWHADTMQKLEMGEAILSVASSLVMAFIAGGISVIYQLEQLPKAMAALIQMAVLYVDYLGIYLLNGWLPLNAIPVFTLIFAVGLQQSGQ